MPDFVVNTFISLESNELSGITLLAALGIVFVFFCYWGMRLLLPLFQTNKLHISKRQKMIYAWGVVGILSLIFLGMIREKFLPWVDSDIFIFTFSAIIVSGCIYFLLKKEDKTMQK